MWVSVFLTLTQADGIGGQRDMVTPGVRWPASLVSHQPGVSERPRLKRWEGKLWRQTPNTHPSPLYAIIHTCTYINTHKEVWCECSQDPCSSGMLGALCSWMHEKAPPLPICFCEWTMSVFVALPGKMISPCRCSDNWWGMSKRQDSVEVEVSGSVSVSTIFLKIFSSFLIYQTLVFLETLGRVLFISLNPSFLIRKPEGFLL